MRGSNKPSNTSIINTRNLNHKETYDRLAGSTNVGSLDTSEKGHILCNFKQPKIFIEITPKGKVIIYYYRYSDLNEMNTKLKKLLVCDDSWTEQDIPRTIQSIQDGIEAHLPELIDQELISELNCENYILSTAPPKTIKALSEGIRNYLTELVKFKDYDRSLREMKTTTEWIITFGVTLSERVANYPKTCNRLTIQLTSALQDSDYGFRLLEEERDGEGLSLRYAFVWRLTDGPLDLPPYPENWEILELSPYKEVYQDSEDYSDSDF